MFLSRLFKNTKAKAMLVLAGLTMVFGVGAAIAVGVQTQANAVVETKAETPSNNNSYMRLLYTWTNSSTTWWSNENVQTQVWTGSKNVESSTSDWFPVSNDKNNYNWITINGGSTYYYYNEVSFSLPSASTTVYMKRYYNGSGHDDQQGSASIGTSGTGNCVMNTTGTTWTSYGFYYKIRLMYKENGTGDYTQYACYLYSNNNTLTLPTLSNPTGYTFGGWYTTSACTVAQGKTIKPAADTVLYAKYTVNSYNLTYKYYNTEGSSIKTADVTSKNYNASVTLPTPSVSGYKFDTWYESDGFGGTARAAGYVFNMPNSAKTFTAKFNRVGFYLVGFNGDWSTTSANYNEGEVGDYAASFTSVHISAGDTFKVKYVNENADDGFYGYTNLLSSSTAYGAFEDSNDGNHNVKVKTDVSGYVNIYFTHFGEDSGANKIVIDWTVDHTPGFYVVGDSTFVGAGTPWSIGSGVRLTHEPSGSDLAAGTNISIPAGSKITIAEYVNSHETNWLHSWGGYPSETCELYKDENEEWNLHYTGSTTATFNIYVNESRAIFIVDQSVIDAAGYLYYSSDSAPNSIALTVTNANDDNPIENGHLSDVADVVTDTNVASFDGHGYLYKIPFYNLRANMVTSKIETIEIGEYTIDVSSTSQTDSKEYYLSGTSYDEDKGTAARTVFNLGVAMNGNSICDMSTSWSSLKSSIEAGYSADATLLSGAEITTYPSGTKTGTHDWLVSDIYKEICRQLGAPSAIAAWPLSARIIPGAPTGQESPLTVTLWVVLGSGLAGLTAIGAAYFISKKKKRHQA